MDTPITSGIEQEFDVHIVVNNSDSKVKEFQDATNINVTLCKLREVVSENSYNDEIPSRDCK